MAPERAQIIIEDARENSLVGQECKYECILERIVDHARPQVSYSFRVRL